MRREAEASLEGEDLARADDAGRARRGGDAPAQLGATRHVRRRFAAAARLPRFVYAAYMAGAMLVAFLVAKTGTSPGTASRQWKPSSASRTTSSSYAIARRRSIGVVVALYLLAQARRRAVRRTRSPSELVEGHAGRAAKRSRTRRRSSSSPRSFATVFFALMDRFWGFVTNMVYGATSYGSMTGEAPGLATDSGWSAVMAKKWYVIQTYSGYENKVKEAAPQQRIKEHTWRSRFGEVLIPTETVQEAARRRQAARPPEDQPPRLHLRRDGDERGGLAPRQGHPEGHRLHRQPAPARGAAAADRGSAPTGSSRARSSRSPASTSRWATRSASSTARSRTSRARSKK